MEFKNISRKNASLRKIALSAFAILALIFNPYVQVFPTNTAYAATINVDSTKNIHDVIANATDGDIVSLRNDIVIDKEIVINKKITFYGNGHTITTDFVKTDNSNNAAIGVQADGVIINNVKLANARTNTEAKLHGVVVYNAKDVKIYGIEISNFIAGIIVNGSVVALANATIENIVWYSINIDKGTSVNPASLKLSGTNNLAETAAGAIFIEDTAINKLVDYTGNYQSTIVDGKTAYVLKEDIVKPEISELTLSEGAYLKSGDKISFIATDNKALKNVVAHFMQNGKVVPNGNNSVSTTESQYKMEVKVPTGLVDGKYNLVLNARDYLDNISKTYNVSFNLDNTKPSVSVASPTSGSLSNGSFIVTGKVSDNNGISRVEILIGKNNLAGKFQGYALKDVATLNGNDFTYNVKNLPEYNEGTYYVRAIAYDFAGNSKIYGPSNLKVDTTAPKVTIANPIDGSKVNGVVAIEGLIEDANPKNSYLSITNLKDKNVIVKDLKLGLGKHIYNWDTTNLEVGEYLIKLEARDLAGNKSSKTSITTAKVYVQKVQPWTELIPSTPITPTIPETPTVPELPTNPTNPEIPTTSEQPTQPTAPVAVVTHNVNPNTTATVTSTFTPSYNYVTTATQDQPVVATTTPATTSTEASKATADKPEVLAEQDKKDFTANQENKCYTIFSLCWYWWIPILIVVALVIYFIARKKDNE